MMAMNGIIIFVSLLVAFLPRLTTCYNVTSYLSKYQIQPAVEASKIPFRCHNGGRVVRGPADYSMFPTGDDGRPLDFLKESSRQGFHCACPTGFTGLRCGRPYQVCDKTSTNSYRNGSNSQNNSRHGHVCFNHGTCIEGLDAVHPADQQFCDCSQALFRGKTFTGKYCEKTAPNLQSCNEEGSHFCVHGQCKEVGPILGGDAAGDDNVDDDLSQWACVCDDGYAGEHCNFVESEGQPTCDLQCGPGTCRITYAHYDEGSNDTLSYWQHNINHTFCSCPPGRTGTTCEISVQEMSGSGSIDVCDDASLYFCMNGGVCKSDYQQSPERPCSCPVGFDGPHCEFEEGEVPECTLDCQNGGVCTLGIQSIQQATDYTKYWEQSVNNMYCHCPDGRHGVHCEVDISNAQASTCGEPPNEVFCFEGHCDKDRGQPVCHCKRGYSGEACQYKQGEVPECNLDCQHGTCVLGIKSLADSNDINRFWDTHVNFTYCRCEPGWYGMNCEIPSIMCGSKTCLGNGTKCAATEDGEGYCDCSSVENSNDPLALAGEHCQYEATSICQTATESYYCYNNGICSDTSAGCDCPEGFTGPVCEYEAATGEPDCSLNCHNGGVCKKGNKYIANVTQNPELDFLQAFSPDNFGTEHCLCKDGYAGGTCETKVEVCGDDHHVCLHGSKCKQEDDGSFRCDCEKAFTPESRYAGKFCQHHHTDICTPSGQLLFSGSASDIHPDVHFCVNDGVCREAGSPGYPGCDCGPLYFGSRCEFSHVYDNAIPVEASKERSIRIGTWVYLFFLLVVFTIFALVAYRIRQKSREMAEIIEESKRWAEESLSPFAAPVGSEDFEPSSKETDSPKTNSPSLRSRLDSVEIL